MFGKGIQILLFQHRHNFMITFKKDINLQQIRDNCRLSNNSIQFDYRVFGIKKPEKEEINWDVKICFAAYHNFDHPGYLKIIVDFFKKYGISIDIYKNDRYYGKYYIGLGYELRQNIPLATAILETIILFLDKKTTEVDFQNFTLPLPTKK